MIEGTRVRARYLGSPKTGRLILRLALCLLGWPAGSSFADPLPPTRNDFGQAGLIEMPSARMAPDADLWASASFFKDHQYYNLGFQFFPWLETDFRYAGLSHFESDIYPVYWDRALSMKVRLWDEGPSRPALAVGINATVGASLYQSEYLVASKQFGAFDGSIGIGWGRLATAGTFKNPLCSLSGSCTRAPFTVNGGNFDFGQYFHGQKAGLFGGVNWRTPVKNLTLQVEYSSDNYAIERGANGFNTRTQLNVGAVYQVSEGTSLGLAYVYGESIAGRVTFELNPVRPQYPVVFAPPLPKPAVRSSQQQQAALNIILASRKIGHDSVDYKAPRAAESRSNAMADALFQEGASDVRLQGQEIQIAATRPRPCSTYAELIGSYDPSVTAVVILDSAGRARRRCDVASRPLLIRTSTVAPSMPLVSAQPVLINAADDGEADFPDYGAAAQIIKKDMAAQKIDVDALNLGLSELTLYYTNASYFSESEALGRIIRVLMADAPVQIERFRLISVNQSIPDREFDVLRGSAERAVEQGDKSGILKNAVTSLPAPNYNPILSDADRGSFPKFSWYVFPQFRQELFDPAQPLGVQFVAVLGGGVELLRGLAIGGDLEGNLYSDFNNARSSNSVLPHVRTDYNHYFSQGANGIADLQAAYRFQLAPSVFAIAKAGYLESMFAGAGGEVLWRPEGQRWAIGMDAYQVWQRGFDRLFDLRQYKAFTGHVSLYYQSPWYDLNFAVRAGQYLAQDQGITFEVSRRFSTGVEVGAFVTRTNVSILQYGEGSFDKGIFIRIPLGWALPVDTQNELDTVLRETQRDGGQRLLGDAVLYDETRRSSDGEMLAHTDQLIQP